MLPIAEGFLNRFMIVSIPKPRDLFQRLGEVVPPVQNVEAGTPIFEGRKNDLCDTIESLADRVPVNDPDIVED